MSDRTRPGRAFDEQLVAELYDRLYPPASRNDFRFYLPLILAAQSVLDVGCGTGALLAMARDAGHVGRLVGLEPAAAMIDRARERADIEWREGDFSTSSFDAEFDLAVMTGHAFQELLTDEQVEQTMAGVRRALTVGGRFAFETRNPAMQAWERWTSDQGQDSVDADGRPVHWEAEVELPVAGDLVRYRSRWLVEGQPPHESLNTLRFIDVTALDSFIASAGLTVSERYGNWDRSPLSSASPEIITIAQRR